MAGGVGYNAMPEINFMLKLLHQNKDAEYLLDLSYEFRQKSYFKASKNMFSIS